MITILTKEEYSHVHTDILERSDLILVVNKSPKAGDDAVYVPKNRFSKIQGKILTFFEATELISAYFRLHL